MDQEASPVAHEAPRVDLDPAAAPEIQAPPVAPAVARYLTEGFGQVLGWGINPVTARYFLLCDDFQKRHGHAGNLFEIGVHHGRAGILLALLARADETTVLADLFERQAENVDRSGQGSRAHLEANLTAWAPGARAAIVQANSLELDFATVPALAAGVRLAHVDGGHHVDAVVNDLRKTEAVLAPHGIVVVDDFMSVRWPEVTEGSYAYLAESRGLAPVAMGRNKLILTTTGNAQALIDHIAARLTPPAGKPVRMGGRPCLSLV
ncbi:MAG: class I SAM-dependent methyltransferase [Paracoccaceae bacterium]